MRSRTVLARLSRLTELERRINCAGLVTNTMDYDPTNPIAVPIPGSLRYEITAAMQTGDTVTFDESKDLGGGAHFGGPITAANTINLPYGSIFIGHALDKMGNPLPFKGVTIQAPKGLDQSKEYVPVAGPVATSPENLPDVG